MTRNNLAIAALLTNAIFACGCTRTIEYEEEVALGNAMATEVIRRREVQELLLNQLSPTWTFSRSEIFLFGKIQPAWADHLRPIYLEKLPDGKAYLLVAAINSSKVCVERGRPTSYYVSVLITPEKALEIPTPQHLNGKAANLLWSADLLPEDVRKVSISDKEQGKYSLIGGLSERERKLLLASKFGC